MEQNKGTARGILAIWNDCRPGTQREYEAWYRGEHLPERLSVPGFRAAWRFRAIEGAPEYFTFYETVNPEVLFSAAYEARVNDPSALTRRVMSGVFTNATRALLTSTASWGVLRGAFAVSLRFEAQPGTELDGCLATLAGRDDVLRAEVWRPTRPAAPAVLSAEQAVAGAGQECRRCRRDRDAHRARGARSGGRRARNPGCRSARRHLPVVLLARSGRSARLAIGLFGVRTPIIFSRIHVRHAGPVSQETSCRVR